MLHKKSISLDHLETHFAPAERMSAEELARQVAVMHSAENLLETINATSAMILILNQQRQILAVNPAVLALLGQEDDSLILGKRPGEMISCIHAEEEHYGCGTSKACSMCGAINAILKTQATGQPNKLPASISIFTNGLNISFDFEITVAPIVIKKENYLLLTMNDIRDLKRKEVMEGLFFHDVLNSVTILDSLCNTLLDPDLSNEFFEEYLPQIKTVSNHIHKQIIFQRKLNDAENNTLLLELTKSDIIDQLKQELDFFTASLNKKKLVLKTVFPVEAFYIISDFTLIHKVVGNMLKNAIEASGLGETIELGFEPADANGNITIWVANPGYIPESSQLQIFNRSFSTKGKNRGLGTYSIRLFTENYLHGKAWFESTPEKGTKFYIQIPIQPPIM